MSVYLVIGFIAVVAVITAIFVNYKIQHIAKKEMCCTWYNADMCNGGYKCLNCKSNEA